jgi:hypothetical protein
LKDSSVDVDENDGDEGDDEELELPVVRVDEGHRRGESEQHDDQDQTDKKSRLGLEPVTENRVLKKDCEKNN